MDYMATSRRVANIYFNLKTGRVATPADPNRWVTRKSWGFLFRRMYVQPTSKS